MRHGDQHNDRDYRHKRAGQQHNLSDYLSRYEDRGNYYGIPDRDREYRNVRSQGSTTGSSQGPSVGSRGSSRSGDYSQGDRHTQGRMHQNEWGSNADYNRGRQSQGRSQDDHYRYGDPSPYMHSQRQRNYGNSDDWRSEGVDHANRRYDRQENSYRQTGHGRRFDQYGRDEKYNYAHGPQDGRRSIENSESLDDRYIDRGEHSRSSSDNDYGRHYGSQFDHRNRSRQGRDDDYESRRYHDRNQDQSPSRSPRGYGHPSGPDYSASSPITNYGPGVRGYQK